ncbi:MAG: glycosyltransferase [Actinomycetales bacterium]|nr:glycosyltransferase [Actinomycetales bacterium]
MDLAVQRPHVLYVAWGYPPCRSGGVYRALATANAFADAGWDVTVLTVKSEVFERFTGADDSLLAHIDPRIEVVRVDFDWPALETDLRRWPALRVFAPRLWRRRQDRRELAVFPERSYGPWRTVIEEKSREIHARKPVNLTVATANPHVAFTAAWALHEQAGVPYVMDYRDAWQLDVFTGARLFADEPRVAQWERRLIAAAREVWFVNEPIAEWHRREYPQAAQRMHVVANGWDPEFAPTTHAGSHEPAAEASSMPDLAQATASATPVTPEPAAPTASVQPRDVGGQGASGKARHDGDTAAARELVFGYIGTVSKKVPIAEFIAGWERAREQSPVLGQAHADIYGYLGFYGTADAATQALLDAGQRAQVQVRGPLAKVDVAAAYAGFDVCLLILGTGAFVTSGKVFEYLASGLPIVSAHDPANAASSVLRGYPLWFPAADLSAGAIAQALLAAAEAALTADEVVRAACREFADAYRRDRQLQPRIATLASNVAGPGAV